MRGAKICKANAANAADARQMEQMQAEIEPKKLSHSRWRAVRVVANGKIVTAELKPEVVIHI